MNLYLVQHAEAKQKEEDPQRPLSKKGWADIRKIASFLGEQMNIQVTSIMHSGKLRAQQTAEVLAEYLNPSEGVEKTEGLEPLANVSIWIERLTAIKKDIILVGHLPHLSKLSSALLCRDENKKIINFQMGGVVCLNRDETGIWSINWMIIPKMLV